MPMPVRFVPLYFVIVEDIGFSPGERLEEQVH